jgi:hypothetical protein
MHENMSDLSSTVNCHPKTEGLDIGGVSSSSFQKWVNW